MPLPEYRWLHTPVEARDQLRPLTEEERRAIYQHANGRSSIDWSRTPEHTYVWAGPRQDLSPTRPESRLPGILRQTTFDPPLSEADSVWHAHCQIWWQCAAGMGDEIMADDEMGLPDEVYSTAHIGNVKLQRELIWLAAMVNIFRDLHYDCERVLAVIKEEKEAKLQAENEAEKVRQAEIKRQADEKKEAETALERRRQEEDAVGKGVAQVMVEIIVHLRSQPAVGLP
jgi:hypothetical protein